MKPRLFTFVFLLCSSCLFSAPKVIDFGTIKSYPNRLINIDESRKIGRHAFNGAYEIGTYIADLKDNYQINIAVETGTFKGDTTLFFAKLFDEVHTVEIIKKTFDEAKSRFERMPNTHCYYGRSSDVLRIILPKLSEEPVLFYLDANEYDDWSLLEELEVISRTHKDNCVVVIDDCKVLIRSNVPFYSYKGEELSLKYVQCALNNIFSDYEVVYLVPKNPNHRAKLVAKPR